MLMVIECNDNIDEINGVFDGVELIMLLIMMLMLMTGAAMLMKMAIIML